MYGRVLPYTINCEVVFENELDNVDSFVQANALLTVRKNKIIHI
jgi:hypothetical protein